MKYNRYIRKSIRKAVRVRDNNQCVKCGAKHILKFDHIILISEGGNSEIDNIQLLCNICHNEKHYHRRLGNKYIIPKIDKETWSKILKHEWEGDIFFLGSSKGVDPHFRELWNKRNDKRNDIIILKKYNKNGIDSKRFRELYYMYSVFEAIQKFLKKYREVVLNSR